MAHIYRLGRRRRYRPAPLLVGRRESSGAEGVDRYRARRAAPAYADRLADRLRRRAIGHKLAAVALTADLAQGAAAIGADLRERRQPDGREQTVAWVAACQRLRESMQRSAAAWGAHHRTARAASALAERLGQLPPAPARRPSKEK